MLGYKAIDTMLEQNCMLGDETKDSFDRKRYQRLVGKLIYPSHTHLDIDSVVS